LEQEEGPVVVMAGPGML
jgi:cleavage and polyadenylation specificity factor subunit 3